MIGRRAVVAIMLVLALVVAVVAGWAGLGALANARARLAAVAALAARGSHPAPPLIAVGQAFAGADRAAAATAFAARIGAAASGHRLLVERMTMLPADAAKPALLAADIALSGGEPDLLAFVRAIEAGRPAIRFASWRLARTAPGEASVRLEARPVGLWEARR
jgi:hypothetical protein